MRHTVGDAGADVDDREADQRAALHGVLEALVARGVVLLRDRATHDVVDELVVLTGVRRLDKAEHACELTRTTRLLLVGVFEVALLGDGLTVGNLRGAGLNLNAILTLDALEVDFEVKLAHAADDGLARLFVARDAEGGVLLREAVERLREVVETLLFDRLDRQRDDHVGDEHRGHGQVGITIGEGIARRTLDAEQRDDIARLRLIDFMHFARVHSHQTANLRLLLGRLVVDGVALLQLALVEAAVGELTVAAILKLERQHDKRVARLGDELNLLLVVALVERLVGPVVGAGEEAHDRVEQRLHTLVLVGRAHEDGRHAALDGRLANHRVGLFGAHLFAAQELLGDVVVEVRKTLDEDRAVLLHVLLEVGRALLNADLFTVGAVVVPGLAGEQVDRALEAILFADRDLHHDGVVRELLAQQAGDAEGVGTRAVELVDEGEAGDVVAAHLAVDRDRLRLNAGNAAKDEDGAVEDAERALNLDREVDVSGGVDDVDRVVLVLKLPVHVGGSRLNRDALLTLELHRVHLGADARLAADLFDAVDLARVEQNALGQRRLARIDVGRDADVAEHVQVSDVRFSHVLFPGSK